MPESNKKILLQIILQNGKTIEVQFPSFEAIDAFTVYFNDKKQISKFIFNDENLIKYIEIIYTYKKPNKDEIARKTLKIKYKQDNYIVDKLKEEFEKYLIRNKEQLNNPDMKVSRIIKDLEYKDCNDIPNYKISSAVSRVFESGYKTIRDVYFELKSRHVKVDIEHIPSIRLDRIYNEEYNPIDDAMESYLRLLNSEDEEERARAMEEIAKYDIEKLQHTYNHETLTPLVDGLGEVRTNFNKELEKRIDKIAKLKPEKRQKLIDDIIRIRDEHLVKRSRKK